MERRRGAAFALLAALLPGRALAEPSSGGSAAAIHAAREAALANPAAMLGRAHLRAVLAAARSRRLGDDAFAGVAISPMRADGPVYRIPAAGPLSRETDASLAILTRPAAAVLAPATGRVAYAGRFRGYGDVLILDHGHGWTTVLTGLAALGAGQGADVRGGDPVGRASGEVRVKLLHHGRSIDVVRIAALLG